MRELQQRAHHGAQHEGERRQLDALRGGAILELGARGFQLGDVGLVELRDVRKIDPARLQARPGNALDAAQRLDFDGTELREIGHLDARQTAGRGGARPAAAPAAMPPPASRLFTNALTSSSTMRPLRPVPRTRARSTPSSRAKRRTPGLAWAAAKPASLTERRRRQAAAADCGGAGSGRHSRLLRRSRCSRRRCCGRGCCGARGGSGSGAFHLQQSHGRARGHESALRDQQLFDHARARRGHIHRRLLGLERQQRRVEPRRGRPASPARR